MDTVGSDRGIVPSVGDDRVIRTDRSTILGADDKSGIVGCLGLITVVAATLSWPTRRSTSWFRSSGRWVGSRHPEVGALNAIYGFVLDTAGEMGSLTDWSPTSVNIDTSFHGRKTQAGVEPEKGRGAR